MSGHGVAVRSAGEAVMVFPRTTGTELDLVHDVSHNFATIETHRGRRLCVHSY